MYTTIEAVYSAAGITSDDISEDEVREFVLDAEADTDRETLTTHWGVETSGTATAVGGSSLTDSSQTLIPDLYQNDVLWIYSGTGSGQARKIETHTSTLFTVDRAWTTTLDTTSKYRVIHCGNDPYLSDSIDGNDFDYLYADKYPLQILETLAINGTTVTPSSVAKYAATGKMQLTTTSEAGTFYGGLPQKVVIAYWWGAYPLARDARRYCTVVAAMKTLAAQMGGTFDDPSSFSLPEASVTVGQAYINIKGTWDVLSRELAELKTKIRRYPSVA